MKGVDQGIDGGQAVFFGKIGQMGISYSGHEAGMPEDCLDMAQT